MIESVVRENTPIYSRGAGYWITPSNHFLSVTTHIAVICTFPGAFGFDAAELQDLFSFGRVRHAHRFLPAVRQALEPAMDCAAAHRFPGGAFGGTVHLGAGPHDPRASRLHAELRPPWT